MKQFKDSTGQTWDVEWNFGTLKRLRDLLSADFLAFIKDEKDAEHAALRVCTDVLFAIDVLWVTVEPQAKALGLSDEQFAARLGGDVGWDAHEALLAEIEDFFRRGRPELRKIVESQRKLLAAGTAKLGTGIDLVTDRQLNKLGTLDLERLTSSTATGSPSDASPAPPESPAASTA